MENQEITGGQQEPVFLGSRIINVFAAPAEAFEGLADQNPRASHWVFPYLIFIVFSILFTYLLFVNEPLKNQIFDLQGRAMQAQVEKGQMTQQQADQIRSQMEGTGVGLFLLFGSIPQIFLFSVYYFGGAFALWLTARFVWKSPARYGKYLEIYGLASWIGVLGYLVTVLMVLGMNSLFASPSLVILVMDSYDALNTGHKFLSAVNVFSIWMAVVTGIGLSKLTGKSLGAGIGAAVGLWILWIAVGVPIGFVR